MGSPGRSSRVTPDDALAVFDGLDDPCAPLTASEVADDLECARRTAYRKLEALTDEGALKSKKTGARGRVWWRPAERRNQSAPIGTGLDRPEEFRALVDAVEEYAIFVMDPDGVVRTWNPGAEKIKGYAEEEIVGEHFSAFYTEEDREAGVPERNLSTAREEGHVEDEGWRVREDGTRFWANVTITAIREDGDVRGFAKITRDMTERKRREDRLAALNEMARGLIEAESTDDVVERTIEAAETDLDLPATAIVLYDEERGVLRSAARTTAAERLAPWVPVFDPGSDVMWDVFGGDESRVVTDLDAAGAAPGIDGAVTAAVALPLGKHGVFVAGFTDPGGVDEAALEFAKLVTTDLEAALDHAERQQLLYEREATLEEQNETLERLNRINGVIRTIDTAIVDATSREAIEQSVCEELAAASPYRFAWIGGQRSPGEPVQPRVWAGEETDRLGDLADATDEGAASRQPAAVAAQTREPHAVEQIHTDPPFEPWRKEALKRGYRTALSVPLAYEDSLYGVLTVFGTERTVAAGMERRVLEELGETIAHAINALESKRALVSDDVVELEFRVSDPSAPILRLVDEADCEFEFENVVSGSDGSYRGYFVTRGASLAAVEAAEERSPAFHDIGLLAEEGDERRFECTLTAESFVATLLDHGAVPRSITAAGGQARLVVAVPRSTDVREFAEMLATKYPGTDLTARRTRERSARTHTTFKADFEARLTERQRETLQTAYFSGFFDEPRKRTGQEVGETMGVSQPTVNHHLRASQRKLLGMLYDEDRPQADDHRGDSR